MAQLMIKINRYNLYLDPEISMTLAHTQNKRKSLKGIQEPNNDVPYRPYQEFYIPSHTPDMYLDSFEKPEVKAQKQK